MPDLRRTDHMVTALGSPHTNPYVVATCKSNAEGTCSSPWVQDMLAVPYSIAPCLPCNELLFTLTMTQSKAKGKSGGPSVPDLLLTGHEKIAQFPLATSSAAPCVASGGEDMLVRPYGRHRSDMW